MPGFPKTLRINSEVLNKMIMLHTDLQTSEISRKVSSFTHLELLVFRIGLIFTNFWKVCHFSTRREKLVRKRELA